VEVAANRTYWLELQDGQVGLGWKMFRSRNNSAQMSTMRAQGCKDLEGFKDGYMEHKKLEQICIGEHAKK
jgi:hypothetical protein